MKVKYAKKLCKSINNKMVLVVLDSLSTWIEVFIMTTITSAKTIEKLREVFARFGLPKANCY